MEEDKNNNKTRRRFLKYTAGALAGSTLLSGSLGSMAAFAGSVAKPKFRVGGVAYSYQYAIGLFQYQKRSGKKFDTIDFLRANHDAGGQVAQIYIPMVQDLDDAELRKIRNYAESIDTTIEFLAGSGLGKNFENNMQIAAKLGSKIAGCNFGFLMRPDKITTLDAWHEHKEKCTNRLKEMAPLAKSLGLKIAVENHFDFTVDEMRDMIVAVDSPYVGSLFDIGNVIGTLDDPVRAAEVLGPYIFTCHYKDFAIRETKKGFHFCMVPLGYGSLQLREITKAILKHVDSDICFNVEMLNGQNFEVNWLRENYWKPFDEKPIEELTATLRHIRGKEINYDEYILLEEVDKMPPDERIKYEQKRQKMCNDYLKDLLDELA